MRSGREPKRSWDTGVFLSDQKRLHSKDRLRGLRLPLPKKPGWEQSSSGPGRGRADWVIPVRGTRLAS